MKHDKPTPSLVPRTSDNSAPNQINAEQGRFARRYVLLALVVPFGLDIWVGGMLLTSVLGAALWGLLITLSVYASRTQDPKLKKFSTRAVAVLWFAWLAAWGVSLVAYYSSLSPDALLLKPLSRTWLVRIHAVLLAGASGLVVLFGVSSLGAIFQIKRVRSSSWSRRSSKLHLPSLESLARVSSSAVFWAFTSWGVGLALAVLTLIVSFESHSQLRGLMGLASDPKILLTCFLWIVLGVAFVVQTRARMNSQRRAYWLASLASIFWCLLAVQAWAKTSSFHEPLRWFIR